MDLEIRPNFEFGDLVDDVLSTSVDMTCPECNADVTVSAKDPTCPKCGYKFTIQIQQD